MANEGPFPVVDEPADPVILEHRLDPQFVPFQRAVGWIVTASVSAGMLIGLPIVWLTNSLPRWGNLLLAPTWLVVTATVAWLSYKWPVLEYRHTSYTLDDNGIEIRSGVFWRQVTTVPRSRVQHTDVSQGPMERAYDLGRLVIYTAGTDHSRVELPGLNHGVALKIRNHLLPHGGDDAV
jgi:membrane protein YdbS with pleckstrin-like domain